MLYNFGNVALRVIPQTKHRAKTNLGAIAHLKTKTRKLFPPLPNEFLEPHPIRHKTFIRAPSAPLTAIFHIHYLSPEILSHRHNATTTSLEGLGRRTANSKPPNPPQRSKDILWANLPKGI
jgi:hypothetical protein